MTPLKEWIDMKVKDGDIDYFEYNNFSNIEIVDEGEFGVVKRADCSVVGIKVALKSLLNNSTIDEEQKKNFLREVLQNIKYLRILIIIDKIARRYCVPGLWRSGDR